jgi:hypothetical protein
MYRTLDITTSLDVILTMDAAQDNNGFVAATGLYCGVFRTGVATAWTARRAGRGTVFA